MQDFRKLALYQRSLAYCVSIYEFSTQFPKEEKYGLTSQIRRAATSIPLNISEGSGCNTKKEFALFIGYAYRSCNEVLTCLELSTKLGLHRPDKTVMELEEKGIELSRMIYGFLRKLD